MSIELKQAAEHAVEAFDAFGDADDFASLFELTQKMRALRTAIQQAEAQQPATPEPVAVHDGVWEALQRLIENGFTLGEASADDALLVAKHRKHLLTTHPAPSVPNDHQIAALVNKVRDIARMFNDHRSLRERIAIELVPALKVSQEAKSNAERGRLLIEWLKRYGLLHAEFGQMGAGEKPENWWLLHAPWGIDQTRPFLGHGKTPEQAIDAMLATK